MTASPRRILQVDTADSGGGAERVMMDLHDEYLARGLDSWVAVGRKIGDDPRVLPLPNDEMRSGWSRALASASARMASRPGRVRLALARAELFLSDPARYRAVLAGLEDFDFPGTSRVLELPPAPPDVLHLHNLHGGYFDVRELPRLTAAVPTVLTMHDAWLLTGHCAHWFECSRWHTGCGQCPHLDVDVPIASDGSARNWSIKHDAVRTSRIALATPSEWLMSAVRQSGLADESELRVIPNGVDVRIFREAERREARAALGLDADATIVLFAAQSVVDNPFKDYGTLVAALASLAEKGAGPVQLVALGADAGSIADRLDITAVPFVQDRSVVARYYQAADMYVHAARAENLPLAVIEAMACGTPVVASRVGGIPELVEDGVNGLLVEPGDPEALAAAMQRLLSDGKMREAFGRAGTARVQERFTIERQASEYLEWYGELIDRWA